MIPVVNDDLVNDFELEQEPSRTYKLHLEKNVFPDISITWKQSNKRSMSS